MKYLILAGLLLCVVQFASADDESSVNPRVAALCQSPAVEGRYSGSQLAHGPVSIYIVCTGVDRIEASWMIANSKTAISLPHVAIDGDQITFASFSLVYDDASTIPANASPAIRLEASFNALKNGVLDADYKTEHNPLPLHIRAHRDQTFPNLLQSRGDGPTPHGTFILLKSKLGLLPLKAPVYIDLDVINGIQRVTVADSASVYYTLYLGMLYEGHGGIFYASSGVDEDQGTVMPQIQIRGHMIGSDIFEFYYFNTIYGMSGPFQATRDHSLYATL